MCRAQLNVWNVSFKIKIFEIKLNDISVKGNKSTIKWSVDHGEIRYHVSCSSTFIHESRQSFFLLNRKNEVSWICSDKIAGSCHPHWFLSCAVMVCYDSQSKHHQKLVLPGVTALQQGQQGLPGYLTTTSWIWKLRHTLTQNLQAVLVHQHNLWEVIS